MPYNDKQNSAVVKKKITAFSAEISTRYLLSTSLDGYEYSLEFARSEEEFIALMKKQHGDIFVMEASGGDTDERFKPLQEAVALGAKGKIRLLVLLGEVPPAEANHMESFGPLCFLEVFFTRKRINDILKLLMEMKDTGCRVKGDSKFFDITLFGKK